MLSRENWDEDMLFRLIVLFGLAFIGMSPAAAQRSMSSGLGVILLYGKGSQAGGPISSLAHSLSDQNIKVIVPSMAWGGKGGYPYNYDVTYEEALKEIDGAIAKLQGQGVTRIVIAGHSLGANAAIAYAARKPAGIIGVVAISPGHMPERKQSAEVEKAVSEARKQIAEGRGSQHAMLPDFNVDKRFEVSGTFAAWHSYFDPQGMAVMPKNAARLTVPLLYVVGRSDSLIRIGRDYIFGKVRSNPKNRYTEIDAGHFDAPDKARTIVIDWLKVL